MDNHALFEKVRENDGISQGEVLSLFSMAERFWDEFLNIGRVVRIQCVGTEIETCAIINARSGRCSENCTFCAQSSWYHTNIEEFPLLSKEEILKRAKEVEAAGVQRFAVVISGRGPGRGEFDKILEIIHTLREKTHLELCASLGIIDRSMAEELKDAGLTMYHHNLETSRDHFPFICTTHSFEDRVKTIRAAQEAQLRVCAGGIIGLGESYSQRIGMIFELKGLGIDSVPINILNPRPGTPIETHRPLTRGEILTTLVAFRLVMPRGTLRLCGGREPGLGDMQSLALETAMNGLMVGGYLTTLGDPVSQDFAMLAKVKAKLDKLSREL